MTSLGADLLLVEGDEDDGVLEVTARLGESPGRLQHGHHTWHIQITSQGFGDHNRLMDFCDDKVVSL